MIGATSGSLRNAFDRKASDVFLYSGLVLFSGSLNRLTGGELTGDALLAEASSSNYVIQIVGIAFYAWCFLLFVKRGAQFRLSPAGWLLGALAAFALLSTVWSGSPAVTAFKSIGLLGTLLFATVAVGWCGIDRTIAAMLRFFVAWILVGAILAMAFPSFAYHSASEYYSIHEGLYKGLYYHKNSFALVASIALVILTFAPLRLGVTPLVRGIAVAVGVVLLLLSGSAKTAFSIPVALAAAVSFKALRPGGRIAAVALAVCLTAVLGAYGVFGSMTDYVISAAGRDPTLSARTDIWRAVINYTLANHPFVGGGYGGGAWKGGVGDAVLIYVGIDPGHSHNGFVHVFAELGALGLMGVLTYFAMIARPLLLGTNARPYYALATALFTTVLISNFAASVLMDASGLYTVVIALLPALLSTPRGSTVGVPAGTTPT